MSFTTLQIIIAFSLISVAIVVMFYYYQGRSFPDIKTLCFLILLSPIAVLLLPIILPLHFYQNRKIKKQKRIRDIERKEKELKKQRLLDKFNSVLTSEDEITANDEKRTKDFLSEVSKDYFQRDSDRMKKEYERIARIYKIIKNPNEASFAEEPEELEESILTPLDAIKLKEGFTIDYYGPREKGNIGGVCHFFVKPIDDKETPDEEADKDIFKYLEIEKTKEGAWQTFILHTAWHSMQLYWHAYYDEWIRIYSYEDWEEKRANLISCAKAKDNEFVNWEKLETLDISKIKDQLTPKVYYKDEEAFVQCYVWNDFSGIKRCSYYIDFKGEQPQFEELEQVTVIPCGNGIIL